MVILVAVGCGVVLILIYLLRHILGGMFGLYRVVPVNEAHIRILQNTKSVFSYREKRLLGHPVYYEAP